MIPFFSPSESDTFQVSSQFKLYWFWTGPITFVVIMTLFYLFGWVERSLKWIYGIKMLVVAWVSRSGLDRRDVMTRKQIVHVESGNKYVEEGSGSWHGPLGEKS